MKMVDKIAKDDAKGGTPVSNRCMAKWPPHSTKSFDSIRRGKSVMAAPHMVCENCSHLFILNCM